MSAPAAAGADATDIEGIEELAAAEKKVAEAKAEIELAKTRLGKAESELDVVKAVLWKAEEAVPVDAACVAEAKLGVAGAKLGVAKAELGVAKAEWQAAPEDKRAVYRAILKTAQDSVEAAQEIVKTANMAYKKALGAPTATPQQASWFSEERHLMAFIEELRKRDERQHREQLQVLRHLTQPQNPWAEMARTSAASDTSSQQGFRTKLSDFYSPVSLSTVHSSEKRPVKCAVTGMVDGTEQVRVVAAHIWPKSAAATFPLDLEDGVNHPSNGIFFHKNIEELFDQLRVCLVCNPFEISATFVVLDGDIVDNKLEGTQCSFRDLHRRQLKFAKDKRPSFQLLSRHAQQAFTDSCNH